MGKVYFEQAVTLPDYSQSYPTTVLEYGDVLIFVAYGKYQLFQYDAVLGLKYRFDIKNYRGSSGSPGTPGMDQEAIDPMSIPAFHFSDTTPSNNSTYWIKSDGTIWEKSFPDFVVVNCPLQSTPPSIEVGQYINPLPDPNAVLWYYDGYQWIDAGNITRLYDRTIWMEIDGIEYVYTYRWRGAEVMRRPSGMVWSQI